MKRIWLLMILATATVGWAFLPAAASESLSKESASAKTASAKDETVGMFGGSPDRNMASEETGLPHEWDVESGKNIKWSMALGSQTYAGPVVAGGRVFVGTNNEGHRNPKLIKDRGVVMAFRESDGTFLWQIAHPKLTQGRVNDWPLQGICSTPYVEGDFVYYVSNRGQVVSADVQGFHDGENDGLLKNEESREKIDGDIVWTFDMISELDVFPHNLTASSPLIVGDLLYTVTSNGVDEDHVTLPSPFAPSFVALNKKTGELVWEDASPGENILHGQWSNPSYGVIAGKPQVLFPGGDGWLYSFEPKTGKLIWKFDCNPKDSKWILGGAGTRNNIIASAVIHDGLVYIGVGQDPEHGEGVGNFWCIDPSKGTGDLTGKALVWHRGGHEFERTISTPAIQGGIVYISDLSGRLYALDAKTGKLHWEYDAFAAIWGSPFVADGKVYLGDEDGDVAVLKTGTEMKLLGEFNVGSSVYTTPAAHNGTLFIASKNRLFAISSK